MKTLKERILEGLASLRQSAPQMTAEEQAELARVEAVAKGETPATTDADKNQGNQPPAAPAPSAEVLALRETVNAQSQQLATLAAQVSAQAAGAQLEKDSARVETLVRQMKMTPAEATTWKQLAKDNPAAFQAAFATQESRPVLAQLRGQGKSVKADGPITGDPSAELSRLTTARAKEQKISVGAAAKQIIAERPELAQAHSDNTPVVAVAGE